MGPQLQLIVRASGFLKNGKMKQPYPFFDDY